MAGHEGHQASPGGCPPQSVRTRNAAPFAPSVPTQVGRGFELLREDAGGVGELIFSMLYNPWQAVVQFLGGVVVLAWVDWRLLLGALLLVPGVYYSDLLWNRRIRPLFRDVRKERQEIDSQTTEVFGGMRVVRAFGRQKSESRGSWAKTISWHGSSCTCGGCRG